MLDFVREQEKILKETLESNSREYRGEKINTYFLRQIQFLQHERLIHLLVTLFIGLYALLSIFFSIFSGKIEFIIVDILLVGLFIPYIFHYRRLENTVQKWYGIINNLNNSSFI
jgi:Ca2+/Na+ antiporter